MHDVTIRSCPECGQPFIPKTKNQVVCSPECKAFRIRRLVRELRARIRAANPIEPRKCAVCGKVFTPRRNYNTVVCSPECRRKRQADQKRRYRAGLAKRRATRVTLATLCDERKEKARRRAEFFAARDAAFDRAGLPIPKVEIRDGVRIERRGTVPAGCNAANFIGHYS